MAILCLSLFAGEIPAGQYFTRFYRRLVERVEVDGAYGAACFDQRIGDRPLLRRHEVTRGVAREIVGARELGEVRRDTRAAGPAFLANDGDEMLRGAIEIKLELAVLVDRAKGSDGSRP